MVLKGRDPRVLGHGEMDGGGLRHARGAAVHGSLAGEAGGGVARVLKIQGARCQCSLARLAARLDFPQAIQDERPNLSGEQGLRLSAF